MVKAVSATKFNFSIATRDLSLVEDLKLRCDCTEELEISGGLLIEELSLLEDSVLQLAGPFGEIDLSYQNTNKENT